MESMCLKVLRIQVVWGEGNDQRDYRRGLLPQEPLGTRDRRIAAGFESMNHVIALRLGMDNKPD